MDWYRGNADWEGGNSLTGYVCNIVGATTERFTPADRSYFVEHGGAVPAAAALLVRISKPEEIADYQKILGDLLSDTSTKNGRGSEEMMPAAIQSLGKSQSPGGRAMLRRLYDEHPDRREMIARAVAGKPMPDDWPLLVRTLQFADSTTMQLCLDGAGRSRFAPKDRCRAVSHGDSVGAQAGRKRRHGGNQRARRLDQGRLEGRPRPR